MRSLVLLCALFLTLGVRNVTAGELLPARTILDRARAEAVAEHKTILLMFQASWCDPCAQFEAFLGDRKVHSILTKYFVIAHLNVGEELNDHAELNNPGGEALMVTFGGATSGLPFMTVINRDGHLISNSNRPSEGTLPRKTFGYPSKPYEIDWFITMLAKGAPSLSVSDRHVIRAWLSSHPYRDD